MARKSSASPRIHSYVIDHDLGFAPNPFGGWCSLACCKPDIRKHASCGDLILGTGSKPNGIAGHLSYWMAVEDIVTFEQYWDDSRFRRKRPDLRGSLASQHGDNIYRRDARTGGWLQVDSFHSLPGGVPKEANILRDTHVTNRVLLGREFCYWGGTSPPAIPSNLRRFVHGTQGHKNSFDEKEKEAMRAWLATLTQRGCIGEPANWPPVP
jgi:hypothetical protein